MISLEGYSELLATLYAAPLDEQRWQQFLAQICDLTESIYGIFTSNDSMLQRRILAHSGMPSFAEAYRTYNESFRNRDPFREGFLRQPRVGIIDGNELCPHHELVKTDLYREFLQPLQLHHMTFVVVSMSPRKYELISMWRGAERPRLDAKASELLRLLMPHLQTALNVRRMLGAAESRAMTAETLLDANPTAAILLDGKGDVVFMNQAARNLALAADGIRIDGDRLSPTDTASRSRFRALVQSAAATQQSLPGGAIALSRRSGQRDLQVLVTPFRTLRQHSTDARVLVLASDPEVAIHFPDAVLRALYDLTPAETEIANGLLTGYSLEEVALLRKVSVATVRSQMKNLLGKTSTRRQGDLVRLLSTLPRTASAVKHFLSR